MKAEVLYVDHDKTTRDERIAAMDDGQQLPAARYKVVRVLQGTSPTLEAACEEIFAKLQAVDAPVLDSEGAKIRSMMIGDMIIFEDDHHYFHRYLCTREGFKLVGLLVGDFQWHWDSRMPPTEVEVKVTKIKGPDSYEVTLYSGMECCTLGARDMHHRPVDPKRACYWQGER